MIRCGDLDSYPLLQHLILSSNRISDIEDDALGRLEIIETLYLNDNQLKRIPVSLPSSLIDLHLENNLITEIQPQVLMGLKTLALLNLSGNKIIYLPGLPLPRLSRLNMRSCELESVNQELVKMSPYLRDLYLEGNPIRCADLLGIAEWATPCRESSGETAESIVVSTANDYFLHKWKSHTNHSCCMKSTRKMTVKAKTDNKVCKEVIREGMPKNNKNIVITSKTTSATVPAKINDNNYLTGNKGSVVVADNKLIGRQSSLSQQQQNNENQKQRQKPDKIVNDKFQNNTDIIGKINDDNNVNDKAMKIIGQTMTLKNKTNIGESTKHTIITRTNISRSFDKLSYNHNNNIKSETTEQIKDTAEHESSTNVQDNQISAKKLIFTPVLTTIMTTTDIDKNLINERVQTNDVNHPIKLSKQKKVSKNWKNEKQLKAQTTDRVINMSSYNKTVTQTPKTTIKVTKSKTKVMAITNDDDYLNDDNKAVVDNFVTVSNVDKSTEYHKMEKSLEAKQLSLHFNFTKIHPTTEASKTQQEKISSTTIITTKKPYFNDNDNTTTTKTSNTHNKINLDKHVQLNRKVNVLQQNSQVVANDMEKKYRQTTQQQSSRHNTEPHQTLNPILNNNDDEVSVVDDLTPQKQEWADTRTEIVYPSHHPSYLGHPGLFMVIGATIGMAVAFGFVHLYRCQKVRQWQHQECSNTDISDISTINTPTHRCHHHYQHHHDLLPMDVLNHRSYHVTPNLTTTTTSLMTSTTKTNTTTPNSPIELW